MVGLTMENKTEKVEQLRSINRTLKSEGIENVTIDTFNSYKQLILDCEFVEGDILHRTLRRTNAILARQIQLKITGKNKEKSPSGIFKRSVDNLKLKTKNDDLTFTKVRSNPDTLRSMITDDIDLIISKKII
jgi:hypothetical protein